MSITVKLSDHLVEEAKRYGTIYSRSVPKQIEYWSKMGRMVEENPDLTYRMIQDILLSQQELSDGDTSDYTFGWL